MKIGLYEASAILTGSFALDGGAMFGTVPKVLWSKTNPADEKNRIDMEARALLLVSEKRKILVDVGLGGNLAEKYGEKFAQKFVDMYKFDQSKHSILKSLSEKGIQPEEITDVILTHLHFDHAGGATTFIDGKLRPTFRNARYYIQKKNLETAQKPNLREKASYFKENFEPLIESGCLEVIDGNKTDLLPSIDVFVTHGHTTGQQQVRVRGDKPQDTLIYGGDIIPTSSHIRGPFVMGYDLNPLLIIEEKIKILSELADSRGILFFEHDPFMDGARVEKKDGDFVLKEKIQL